jgi:methyl-accepting chemotaxis protein
VFRSLERHTGVSDQEGPDSQLENGDELHRSRHVAKIGPAQVYTALAAICELPASVGASVGRATEVTRSAWDLLLVVRAIAEIAFQARGLAQRAISEPDSRNRNGDGSVDLSQELCEVAQKAVVSAARVAAVSRAIEQRIGESLCIMGEGATTVSEGMIKIEAGQRGLEGIFGVIEDVRRETNVVAEAAHVTGVSPDQAAPASERQAFAVQALRETALALVALGSQLPVDQGREAPVSSEPRAAQLQSAPKTAPTEPDEPAPGGKAPSPSLQVLALTESIA